MMGAMSGLYGDSPFEMEDNTLHNGVTREYHPWDHIQLSKKERKGKTYEELQALRKKKYEESLERNTNV